MATGRGRVALATVALVAAAAALVDGSVSAGVAASPLSSGVSGSDPTHAVTIGGVGVATYPAFDPETSRYAITTGEATDGTVTVTATSTDPAAVFSVDGSPAPGGERTVSGLEPGDEVAVFVDDASGLSRYSYVYLPDQFPTLRRDPTTVDRPSPGHVLLTLGLWTEPSPFFETAVDPNGVPAYVRETFNSADLKPTGDGHYTVARGRGDQTGADLIELDGQFREVGRYRTVGLVNTDTHDSAVLPDGSRYLLAYEPNPATGRTDAVVQHVSPTGDVLFSWNSADHVDIPAETVVGDQPDYAHVNSLDVMADGDLLLSFRHLSAVFKVARRPHDGFAAGDVVWRLGGRRSSFAFTGLDGRPDGGPCAQHTATELPDGDIMVFDNGAWSLNPLCIDPDDPAGDTVARTPSRVVRWRLDESAGTATTVSDRRVGSRYAIFAGSAQLLPGGSTLIGWASSTAAVASELGPDGTVLWDLQDSAPDHRYFTYRAHKAVVPDVTPPAATVTAPVPGAVIRLGETVTPSYRCTDRGGSSLSSCTPSAIETDRPGTHTMTLTAVDGAGNRTVVRRTYEVRGTAGADGAVKPRGARSYVGFGVHGPRPRQQARLTVAEARPEVALLKVRNTGDEPGRFRLRTSRSGSGLAVRVAMAGGGSTSPVLDPGASWTGRVRVSRLSRAGSGRVVTRLDLSVVGAAGGGDTLWVVAQRRSAGASRG